jgi:hypothetical protein
MDDEYALKRLPPHPSFVLDVGADIGLFFTLGRAAFSGGCYSCV